jgi:hypothetical protein
VLGVLWTSASLRVILFSLLNTLTSKSEIFHLAFKMKFPYLLVLLMAAFSKAERAVLETCSGCKLNRFPDVRKFVMSESHGALSFEGVTRKFIQGHNPDIVFYEEDGTLLERFDMTEFPSFESLINLLQGRGYHRKRIEL